MDCRGPSSNLPTGRAAMAKIEVDDKVIAVLEKRAREKSFTDVGDYIRFVLGQIAEEIGSLGRETMLTQDDEEDIKERLKSLGYLE
jgi:hypothetical protein